MTFLKRLSLTASVAVLAVAPAPAQAIVGGTDAQPGEFPSIANLVIDGAFQCTGTLVAPDKVVTAAHCDSIVPGGIVNLPVGAAAPAIQITVGGIQGDQSDGFFTVGKLAWVNPGWAGVLTSGYDVGVVELLQPVPADQGQPVKIAGPGEEATWAPGTMATIAGFGATEWEGDLPDTLQKAQVPIVADSTSAAAYPDSFENQTQIGAGYAQGGTDTCQGDSGGPLYVPISGGGYRLAGDTSYGFECARAGYPGIYGRLGDTTMRSWLETVLPPESFGSGATAAGGGGGTTTKGGKGGGKKSR